MMHRRLVLAVFLCILCASSSTGIAMTAVRIAHGQSGFPSVLDDHDGLGAAIVSLGDFDNDGREELAVGADGDDDGALGAGAVWILDVDASGQVVDVHKLSAQSVTGLAFSDGFGGSVAWLGDFDNDPSTLGVLAVGSPGDDRPDGNNDGRVYLLFLNAATEVARQVDIAEGVGGFTGNLDVLDEFGTSIASLGDLDGLGPTARALAVGAFEDDDGGQDTGAVYILFLNGDGTVASHRKLNAFDPALAGAIGALHRFGFSVSSLGDRDMDPTTEVTLAVGSPRYPAGGFERGAVWLLGLGGDGSIVHAHRISTNEGGFLSALQDDDYFGEGVAAAGDFDGDGIEDLAVGAAGDDDGGFFQGSVWLLGLDESGVVGRHTKVSSGRGGFPYNVGDGSRFGHAVALIGDLDGDGKRELAVGANQDSGEGASKGAVWILYLGTVNPTSDSQPIRPILGLRVTTPFRDRTRIEFSTSSTIAVSTVVFDTAGRVVRRLGSTLRPAGYHTEFWDGRDEGGRHVSSGVYVVRVQGPPSLEESRRVVYLR